MFDGIWFIGPSVVITEQNALRDVKFCFMWLTGIAKSIQWLYIGWKIGVRFWGEIGIYFLFAICSGVSYLVGTEGSLPEVKGAEKWIWPLPYSAWVRMLEVLYTLLHLSFMVLWCYGFCHPYRSPHKKTMTCRFWCSMPVKSKGKFIPVDFIKVCDEVECTSIHY
jgi:hypothetical protein